MRVAARRRLVLAFALLAAAVSCRRDAGRGEAAPALPPVQVEEQLDLIPRLAQAVPDPGSGLVDWAFPVLRDDQREALVMQPPARLRFRGLPIHPGAVLEFGYGVAPPPGPSIAPVTFRVEWSRGGARTELFAAAVEVLPWGENEWREAAVPMPSGAAGGELVLAVEGPEGSGVGAAWSWPTIRSAGRRGPDDRARVRAETRRLDLLARTDAATKTAAPDGRAPGALQVELPDDLASRTALGIPPGAAIRFALEPGAGDLLRLRFHVAPAPDAPSSVARGRLRLVVAFRSTTDAAARDGPAAWQVLGETFLELASEAPWRRDVRAEFALPTTDGAAELELRVEGTDVVGRVVAGLSELAVVTTANVARRGAGEAGRNVLVLLVDALRADRLGLYGCPRDTSPNLDRAARDGLVFDRAYTPTPWTLPAVVSLLTGVGPTTHGIVNALDSVLPADRATLPDALRAAGYTTAAFLGNPLIGESHGFRPAFEHFEECFFMDAARLNRRLFRWLRTHRTERFFAYVHYMEPHAPYAAPDPFYDFFSPGYSGRFVRNTWNVATDPTAAALGNALSNGVPVELRPELGERAEDLGWRVLAGNAVFERHLDLYDGEVRFWDEQFGRLRRELEELGLARDTIVVVVSDHGEEFAEHGRFGHGFDFFDEALRVPLVILDPAETRPRRVAGTTSLTDLIPLLLDRLDLTVPAAMEGWTLDAVEGPAGAGRAVLSHSAYFVPDGVLQRAVRTPAMSLRDAGYQLLCVPRDGVFTAFRIAPETGAHEPLPVAELPRPEWPGILLREHARQAERALAAPRAPSARDEQLLRALGYIR
ncbi:MAG: sulfatase [Deltaproteobacteria bacterium]|nr:sulfatase [Deltaproteobacteria bacterium]